MVVVLAVGARFRAQASSGTLTSSVTAEAVARVDVGQPVNEMMGMPRRAKTGNRRRSSSVSPE